MSSRRRGSAGTAGKGPERGGKARQAPQSSQVHTPSGRSSDDEEEEEDVLARTSLDLSNHPMPPLDALTKTISQFRMLQRLDVSSMKASEAAGNPHGLTSLAWLSNAARRRKGGDDQGEGTSFGDKLGWLKMTDNPGLGQHGGQEVWNGLERLTGLTVLNASSCALSAAPPPSVFLRLSSLGALILAHNSIATFTSLPHLPQLNTLVLSHNRITSLPPDLPANLPSLKKLSITQNALEWKKGTSPLPDFTACSHLREIRLSGNSRLARLPPHLSTWGRGEGSDKLGTGLETLEITDCGLSDWDSIGALMKMAIATDEAPRRRRGLGNLSLKGNGVAKASEYRERILAAHPSLRTFDGDRVVAKAKEPIGVVEEVGEQGKDTHALSDGKPATGRGRVGKEFKGRKERLPHAEAVSTVEVDAKSGEQESVEKAKQRKRGKRGGGGPKDEGRSEDKGSVPSTKITKQAKREKVPMKKAKESKEAKEAKEAVVDSRAAGRAGPPPSDARAASRAGPPPSKVGPKGPKENGTDAAPSKEAKKKRKAWDEGEHGGRASEQKKARGESPKAKVEKAQTSVAGVIQLGKRRPEGKAEGPIWGQLGGPVNVGLGGGASAWD